MSHSVFRRPKNYEGHSGHGGHRGHNGDYESFWYKYSYPNFKISSCMLPGRCNGALPFRLWGSWLTHQCVSCKSNYDILLFKANIGQPQDRKSQTQKPTYLGLWKIFIWSNFDFRFRKLWLQKKSKKFITGLNQLWVAVKHSISGKRYTYPLLGHEI